MGGAVGMLIAKSGPAPAAVDGPSCFCEHGEGADGEGKGGAALVEEGARARGALILPAAHDALTARLIERAGFRAYQIGGFALSARGTASPTST